jgi:hypothetical protein
MSLAAVAATGGTALAKAAPDLATRGVVGSDDQLTTGSRVAGDATIYNLGKAGADTSRAAMFLSTDGRLDATDKRVATISVPRIGAGDYAPVSATIRLRAEGSFKVFVCADSANAIAEKRERNNCAKAAGRLQVTRPAAGTQQPDPGQTPGGGQQTPAPATTAVPVIDSHTFSGSDPVVSGRAVPGARVEIYVRNACSGPNYVYDTVTADAQGRFTSRINHGTLASGGTGMIYARAQGAGASFSPCSAGYMISNGPAPTAGPLTFNVTANYTYVGDGNARARIGITVSQRNATVALYRSIADCTARRPVSEEQLGDSTAWQFMDIAYSQTQWTVDAKGADGRWIGCRLAPR